MCRKKEGERMDKEIEIRTDDERDFGRLCKILGFNVEFDEIESSEVEFNVIMYENIHGKNIIVKYAYVQGLRYGVYNALLVLEKTGKIEIVDIKWRVACPHSNCNHITHYAEEPFSVKLKIRGMEE
jgi:hypothetical protein